MNRVAIYKPGKTVDDTQIIEFERFLLCELPKDYVAFLKKYNGGCPNPNVFTYFKPNSTGSSVIQVFFGFNDNNLNDIQRNKQIYSDRIPEELLPIARDVFGNIICIACKGKNRGQIYLWHHEYEYGDNPLPSYDAIFPIASNFRELLEI